MQLQQQAAEATERRNRLAVQLDDCRREVRLLEGRSAAATEKAEKIQLDLEVGVTEGREKQAEQLQHRHWENLARGVKVTTADDSVMIDLYVIVEYGISINAVCTSVLDTIKYKVETLMGIHVSKIHVHVQSVRV